MAFRRSRRAASRRAPRPSPALRLWVALGALLIAGCKTEPGPTHPQSVPPAPPVPARPAASTSDAGEQAAPAGGPDGGTEVDVEAMFDNLDEEESPIEHYDACFDLHGAGGCMKVGVVMLVCNGLANLLRTGATQQMIACLTEKNGTEALCSVGVLENCGLSAIRITPVTETAVAQCRELFDTCAPPEQFKDVWTESNCESGLSSLRDRPRRDFTECMKKRCDLRLCLGGML